MTTLGATFPYTCPMCGETFKLPILSEEVKERSLLITLDTRPALKHYNENHADD